MKSAPARVCATRELVMRAGGSGDGRFEISLIRVRVSCAHGSPVRVTDAGRAEHAVVAKALPWGMFAFAY